MARPKNSKSTSVVSPVPDSHFLSFSLKQAAAVTGVAVWHLRTAIWDGKLTAHMAGKKQIVLRTDLERWLASQPVVHRRAA
jgi:excisionase family DNA binding protein